MSKSLLEAVFEDKTEQCLEGFLVSIDNIDEITVDDIIMESYLNLKINNANDIATEGATFQALKSYYGKEARQIRKDVKKAKKLAKKKEYDEAIKMLKDIKDRATVMLNKVENIEGTVPSTICSFLFNCIPIVSLISIIPVRPSRELEDKNYSKNLTDRLRDKIRKGNLNIKTVISFYNYFIKSCDRTIIELNKLKKEG